MSRAPLVVANWKMYKTPAEARAFIKALRQELPIFKKRVWIAPSFVALQAAIDEAEESMVWVGAQNMHAEDEGAFTGEVSCSMIHSVGARFVIVGHSERRCYFAETDKQIQQKVKKALAHDLIPILCVGETLEQREAGEEKQVLHAQLKTALEGVGPDVASSIVIAYEPVWAIGTGRAATAEIAQEAHRCIRDLLEELFSREISEKIALLYGGSVKPENMTSLMEQTDIDGALVGGASLELRSFIRIINS